MTKLALWHIDYVRQNWFVWYRPGVQDLGVIEDCLTFIIVKIEPCQLSVLFITMICVYKQGFFMTRLIWQCYENAYLLCV